MRKQFFLSTAMALLGLTLVAGPTLAEDRAASPSTTTTTSGPTGTAAAVDAKKLIGEDVRNTAGDRVGEVNTVILDKSGQVKSVIVGVGGFLGVGEREVAMRWQDLKMAPSGDYIIANVTKEQVQALPEYKFTDPSRRGTIFSD